MRLTAARGLRSELLPSVLVLVLVLLPPPTRSFSRGASGSSCARMVPGHVHAHPHDGELSHVTLHTSGAQYLPGHLLTVTVRSSRDFMGFLLQARSAEPPGSRGRAGGPGGMGAVLVGGAWTLTPPGTHTIRCVSDGDTVTHSDKQLKRNLSFVWRAPDRPMGDVRFYMTVVQSYFVYWTGIRSPVLHDGTRSRWRGYFNPKIQAQATDEDSFHEQEEETANTTSSPRPAVTIEHPTGFKRLRDQPRLGTPPSPLVGKIGDSTAGAQTEAINRSGTREGWTGTLVTSKALDGGKSTETDPGDSHGDSSAPESGAKNENTTFPNQIQKAEADPSESGSPSNVRKNVGDTSEAEDAAQNPQTDSTINTFATTSPRSENNLIGTPDGKIITESEAVELISEQKTQLLSFNISQNPTDEGKRSSSNLETSEYTLDLEVLRNPTENPRTSTQEVIVDLESAQIKPKTESVESGHDETKLSTAFPNLVSATPIGLPQNFSGDLFEGTYFDAASQTDRTSQIEPIDPEEMQSTNFSSVKSIKDLLLYLDSLFEDKTTVQPSAELRTNKSAARPSLKVNVRQEPRGKHRNNTPTVHFSNMPPGHGVTPLSKSSHQSEKGEKENPVTPTNDSAKTTDADQDSIDNSMSTGLGSQTPNWATFNDVLSPDYGSTKSNSPEVTSKRDFTPRSLFHDESNKTISKASYRDRNFSHFHEIIEEQRPRVASQNGSHVQNTSPHFTDEAQESSKHQSEPSTLSPTDRTDFATRSRPESSTSPTLNTASTNCPKKGMDSANFSANLAKQETKNPTVIASTSRQRSLTKSQETTRNPSLALFQFSPTSEYFTPTGFQNDQNPTPKHELSPRPVNRATTNEQPRWTAFLGDTPTAHVLEANSDQKAVAEVDKIAPNSSTSPGNSTNVPWDSRSGNVSVKPKSQSDQRLYGHDNEPEETTIAPTAPDDFDRVSKYSAFDFLALNSKFTKTEKASTIVRPISIARTESVQEMTSDDGSHLIVDTSEFQQKEIGIASGVTRQSIPRSDHPSDRSPHAPSFRVAEETFPPVSDLQPRSTGRVRSRSRAGSRSSGETDLKLASKLHETPSAPVSTSSNSKVTVDSTERHDAATTGANPQENKESVSPSKSNPGSSRTPSHVPGGFGTTHFSKIKDKSASTTEDTFTPSDQASRPSLTKRNPRTNQAPKYVAVSPGTQNNSLTSFAKIILQNPSLENIDAPSTTALPSTFSSFTRSQRDNANRSTIIAETKTQRKHAQVETTETMTIVAARSGQRTLSDGATASVKPLISFKATFSPVPMIAQSTTTSPTVPTRRSYKYTLMADGTASSALNVTSTSDNSSLINGSSSVDLNDPPQSYAAPSSHQSKTGPKSILTPQKDTTTDPKMIKSTSISNGYKQTPTKGKVESLVEESLFSSSPGQRLLSLSQTGTTSAPNVSSTKSTFHPSNVPPVASTVSSASSSARSKHSTRACSPGLKGGKVSATLSTEAQMTSHTLQNNSTNTFISTRSPVKPKSTDSFSTETLTTRPVPVTTSLTLTTSAPENTAQATTEDDKRLPTRSTNGTSPSFSSTLRNKQTFPKFPKLPALSPVLSPKIVSDGSLFSPTAEPVSSNSSAVGYRPSAARRSFIDRFTTFVPTLAQKPRMDAASSKRDAKANPAVSRISNGVDQSVKPKAEIKAKLPPYPDPDREGKYPAIIPRHSAWELGMLLGCSAGLGMVLVVGLRYVYRQACGRRTQVTLHDREAEYARGGRGLIHLQECGDLVRVRRIRENSFVLLAEYDILSAPGD